MPFDDALTRADIYEPAYGHCGASANATGYTGDMGGAFNTSGAAALARGVMADLADLLKEQDDMDPFIASADAAADAAAAANAADAPRAPPPPFPSAGGTTGGGAPASPGAAPTAEDKSCYFGDAHSSGRVRDLPQARGHGPVEGRVVLGKSRPTRNDQTYYYVYGRGLHSSSFRLNVGTC